MTLIQAGGVGARRAAAPPRAGVAAGPRGPVLSSKLEIQAEILNHWRYTAINERYCMTHGDTGHENLTVKSLHDFSLL